MKQSQKSQAMVRGFGKKFAFLKERLEAV